LAQLSHFGAVNIMNFFYYKHFPQCAGNQVVDNMLFRDSEPLA
jgi:hypothetical protein